MKPRFTGLFFVLFSLIFLTVGGVMALKQARRLTTYTPIDAEVLSKQITETRSSKGGRTYAPSVTYRYKVGGTTYDGNRVMPIEFSSSYAWAERIADRFTVGSITQAYHDPANPGEAFLLREASFFPYIFVLFPMIFFCVGLTAWMQRGRESAGAAGLLAATAAWWVVGFVAAGHYLSLTERADMFAKVALPIYGVIGVVMLLMAIRRLLAPAPPAANA